MKLTATQAYDACATCALPVAVGTAIAWKPGRVDHFACTPEGQKQIASIAASRALDAPEGFDVPAPKGQTYMPFQKAGIAYAVQRRGTLFGDEMGLGKSVQTIGVLNATLKEWKNVLIVCPASLVLNWRNELDAWLADWPADIRIFPQYNPALGESPVRAIVITNYEQIDKLYQRMPPGFVWDVLVVDEAHFAKSTARDKETGKLKVKRAAGIIEMGEKAKRCLVLTGTPIPTHVKDLWNILCLIDPETWAKGKYAFFRFGERYCGGVRKLHCPRRDAKHEHLKSCYHWDFNGSSHEDELQEKLRSTVMVRRLKKDVLTELPPKRYQVLVVPCDAQHLLGAEDKALRAHKAPRDYQSEDSLAAWAETVTLDPVAFEDVSRVRHQLALDKVPIVLSQAATALESGVPKILVWAHHKDVLDELTYGLENYGVVSIAGEDSQAKRQEAVEQFQTDPAVRVFVGSIKAAGTGLTLTAASHEIFAELSFDPSELSQAIDRAHRIGQRESVLVQFPVYEGTLDARMATILVKKMKTASAVLDASITER